MGRLLRYLIMFGPMLYRMYKKFTAGRQTSNNMPQQQLPRQEPRVQQRTSGSQSKSGNWDFKEGQNPLG